MFHINKQEFGAFISMLRKEKGITQKELAEQLFISDKAVSKWETGISVPNIDLLVPLADILGVTVTELLMCQRMEQNHVMSTTQVEQVVKTAVLYSEEEQIRAYQNKGNWGVLYIVSLLIACLEMVFVFWKGHITNGLVVTISVGAIFGIYFCFFVKETLPIYYDENSICVYTDGIFEMHLPGLSLNNTNWKKILKVGRIWALTLMVAYPIISYIETLLFTGIVQKIVDGLLVFVVCLGGLFLPIYIVGKKYK